MRKEKLYKLLTILSILYFTIAKFGESGDYIKALEFAILLGLIWWLGFKSKSVDKEFCEKKCSKKENK